MTTKDGHNCEKTAAAAGDEVKSVNTVETEESVAWRFYSFVKVSQLLHPTPTPHSTVTYTFHVKISVLYDLQLNIRILKEVVGRKCVLLHF